VAPPPNPGGGLGRIKWYQGKPSLIFPSAGAKVACLRIRTINRTQALVLGFFALALIGFVAILVLAPNVYSETLKLRPGGSRLPELAFLLVLTAFLVLLGIGTVRRWRWIFWLILVAFLTGILRLATSPLQLMGVLPATGPVWYMLLQASIGAIQFLIGLAMIAGYRRSGPWGAF
jgi:hypothetical protein